MLYEVITLDAPRGFEPRLTESESVVLPLDDGATRRAACQECQRGLHGKPIRALTAALAPFRQHE